MKFKTTYLPYFALGAGILGLLLQIWLHATGLEESGLFQAGHPAEILLYILTAIGIGGIALALRPIKGTPAYDRMFRPSILAAAGSLIAAIGILTLSLSSLSGQKAVLEIIRNIAGILTAIALVYDGLCRAGVIFKKINVHSIVAVYVTLFLVAQYTGWNSQPQLQKYFFQLLASIFLMMTTYFRACLSAGRDHRRTYAFFHCGALLLSCTALQDQNWLFYLSLLIWLGTSQLSMAPQEAPTAMKLPDKVLYCIQKLEDCGFSAYAVGGCVRDYVLGLEPNDYDLCTDARPAQIADIFQEHQLVLNGEKHGTVGVILEHEVFEITTFRTEGGYSDNRHPDWVNFVTSVKEDLARRDFTVNAMAYAPSTGYIDPWCGQEDLENRLLRTVGNATARFREDPLRILRGVRFAVTYRLTPEPKTARAMLAEAPLLDTLAKERVFSELCKLLPRINAQQLLLYAPILGQVIPELTPMFDFQQHSPHHAYDVFTHTAKVVEATMPELPLRLAALLHDVGKPSTFTADENGRGHFYGHAKVGAEMANEILLRLKAPTALRNQVVFLIEHHMTRFEPDKKLLRKQLGKYGEDMALMLLDLQKADFTSKGVVDDNDPFPQVEALIAEIQNEDSCLTVRQLAVKGHDLLELGLEPGPHIGECMAFLLSLVQDEIVENTKEDLLPAAKNFFNL